MGVLALKRDPSLPAHMSSPKKQRQSNEEEDKAYRAHHQPAEDSETPPQSPSQYPYPDFDSMYGQPPPMQNPGAYPAHAAAAAVGYQVAGHGYHAPPPPNYHYPQQQHPPANIPVLRPGVNNDDGSWVCKFCQRSNFRQFTVCVYCENEPENLPNFNPDTRSSSFEPYSSYQYQRDPMLEYRALLQEPLRAQTSPVPFPPPPPPPHAQGYVAAAKASGGYAEEYEASTHPAAAGHAGSKRELDGKPRGDSKPRPRPRLATKPPTSKTDSPNSKKGKEDEKQKSKEEEKEPDEELDRAIAYLEDNNLSDTYTDGTPVAENHKLIIPEDRLLLSDYLCYLMKQLRRCEFTERDRKTRGGKREALPVGYAGLQCVHCAQHDTKHYPRKFFWAHADRLANSFAEIPNHILKCRSCPKETQQALLVLKSRHPDQMTKLARGSQKVYFRRMWKRALADQEEQQLQPYYAEAHHHPQDHYPSHPPAGYDYPYPGYPGDGPYQP